MGKSINIAINGFGRIGRTLFRVIHAHFPTINVVAINDLMDSKTLMHLLKYDSIHGRFDEAMHIEENYLVVANKRIKLVQEPSVEKLPWQEFGIDVVVDCTGKYLDKNSLNQHVVAGAKKVVLSAPPSDKEIKTICIGINDNTILSTDTILSNASCTTNSAAPMIKVLNENWGLEQAYITTVHSYTTDQKIHDSPHKDLRRARAAGLSIIPTSTGAAKAITRIFPELEGKIGGCGMRVPVPNGSLTDITCVLKNQTSVQEINNAFKKAAETNLKGILEYTEDPIVSIDVIGNNHSCIFDADFTSIVNKMVKVVGWYDNEFGYSYRLAELIQKVG